MLKLYYFTFLLYHVFSAPAGDLVKSLPLTESFKITFNIYSGYLAVPGSDGKELHYLFMESKSAPKTDPLVLWLNGGPGCSSMEGAFMENGPFYFEDGKMVIHENPYSWNHNASMLYFEAPAGVGYSVLGDPSNANTNDNITASDNMQALAAWFDKFPEFLPNEFYITGESYAGIYVPTLVNEVLEYNTKHTDKAINIKGFAVGNGVVDWEVDAFAAWPYVLWWHGLIGYDTWTTWDSNKCTFDSTSSVCKNTLDTMMRLFTGINYYDIYRPCIYGDSSKETYHKARWGNLGGIENCVPDIGLTEYMNMPSVREALNIKPTLGAWTECTDQLNYTIGDVGSFYLYRDKLVDSGLRIRIYSGDTDTSVAPAGTRQWIKKLGMERSQEWKEWSLDNQVAGFYETYKGGNFTFMTIKGSGHMCIQWKRPQGFRMFSSFLLGVDP